MIYAWLGLLTLAVVYLWFRKPRLLVVDGFSINVEKGRLIIRNDEGKIIFNTGT